MHQRSTHLAPIQEQLFGREELDNAIEEEENESATPALRKKALNILM